jgi:NAD(P)-dependent dehydrogenase (short-subunit alcohol dehydrogenase family)
MTKRRFGGQVALITGGGSGIGRALAEALASEGAVVAVAGRRKDKLTEVTRAIEASGGRALAVACDVTDEASVERAIAEVVAAEGRLDIAIANAGFAVSGRIENLTAADWRRQLDTNVVGLAITARHAMPHLRNTKGRIVLVGSVASVLATPGVGAYAASKFAVRAIGQALGMEMAGTGVTCTTLLPGFVESEISQVDNGGVHHEGRPDGRPQKLMWKAADAARVCVDAIHARKREFVFTGHGKLGVFVGQHFPGVVPLLLAGTGMKKGLDREAKKKHARGKA